MAAAKPLFQSKIDVCDVKKEKKADKVSAIIKKQLPKTVKAKPKPVTARVFQDKMELTSADKKKKVPIDVVKYDKIQKVSKGPKQDKTAVLTYEGDKKKPVWLIFLRFNTDKGYEEFLKVVNKENKPEAVQEQEQPAPSPTPPTSKPQTSASVPPQQPSQLEASRDLSRRSSSVTNDKGQSTSRPAGSATRLSRKSISPTSSTQSLTPINQYSPPPPTPLQQTQQPSRRRSTSSSSSSYSSTPRQQSITKQSRPSSRQQPSQAERPQSAQKRASSSSSSSSSSSLSSEFTSSSTRQASAGRISRGSTSQDRNKALTKTTYVEYPVTKSDMQSPQAQYLKESSKKQSRSRTYETTFFTNTADGGLSEQKTRSRSHESRTPHSTMKSKMSPHAPVRVFKYVPGKGVVKSERGKMFYYSSDTEFGGRGRRRRNTSTSSSDSSSSDTVTTQNRSRQSRRDHSGKRSVSAGRGHNTDNFKGRSSSNLVGYQPKRRQEVGFDTICSSSSSSSTNSSSDSGHSSDWQRGNDQGGRTRGSRRDQKLRDRSNSSESSISSTSDRSKEYFAVLPQTTQSKSSGFPRGSGIRRL
nr:unnamed protein product [Spirometra erinaceieuropaei]